MALQDPGRVPYLLPPVPAADAAAAGESRRICALRGSAPLEEGAAGRRLCGADLRPGPGDPAGGEPGDLRGGGTVGSRVV